MIESHSPSLKTCFILSLRIILNKKLRISSWKSWKNRFIVSGIILTDLKKPAIVSLQILKIHPVVHLNAQLLKDRMWMNLQSNKTKSSL